MNVGIICSYPVPYGMAATTRIFSYSRGLVECGDQVDVWSVVPTGFAPELNIHDSGVFNGISFFYSFRRRRMKNHFLHGLEIVYSLLVLGIKLYKRSKRQMYDVFIVSSDNILILSYMSFINIFFRKKLVFIFDEYPIPIRVKLKDKIPLWKRYAYRLILKYYTGYISMTDNLLKYYKKIVEKPGILLSSITDISRFENINKIPSRQVNKIVYMGNMELSKDNVDNILYAVSILRDDGYDFHLYLYGKPSVKDKKVLESIIEQKNMQDYVSFGFVQFDDVPKILSQADILVSSQPVTVRASGGFPTKLGEYLMSGTPVLLTDVGETSHYFKNGEHLYFAKPESPIDFADKLKLIINNYETALTVASNGKRCIENFYSHSAAGMKMHNFLTTL